jgi:hypothetical protein
MRRRLVVAAVAALVATLIPSVAHAAVTTTTLTISPPGVLLLSPTAGAHSDYFVQAGYTAGTPTPTMSQFWFQPELNGPDIAPHVSYHITGLDTSLGVPAGCAVSGGAVDCGFDYPYGEVKINIPLCSVFRPVTITISINIVDTNPANNTTTVPPLDYAYGCAGAGGAGGGSGGSGGGGATPPSSAAPTTPAPTSTVDAVATANASPTATAVGSTPPVTGALIARHTTGPTWSLLTPYIGGAVGVAFAVFARWLWRRRRAGGGEQGASDATSSSPAD